MFFSFLLNSLIFSISLRMFKLFCMFFSFLLNSLIFSFNSVSALPLSLRTSLRSPLRLSISDLTSAADLSAHFAIILLVRGAARARLPVARLLEGLLDPLLHPCVPPGAVQSTSTIVTASDSANVDPSLSQSGFIFLQWPHQGARNLINAPLPELWTISSKFLSVASTAPFFFAAARARRPRANARMTR